MVVVNSSPNSNSQPYQKRLVRLTPHNRQQNASPSTSFRADFLNNKKTSGGHTQPRNGVFVNTLVQTMGPQAHAPLGVRTLIWASSLSIGPTHCWRTPGTCICNNSKKHTHIPGYVSSCVLPPWAGAPRPFYVDIRVETVIIFSQRHTVYICCVRSVYVALVGRTRW